MQKHLVIVESPAKAKTITKYLGPGYKVLASYGHVRDLVPKNGAVDTEHGFSMDYQLIDRNKKHVNEIVKALRSADVLLLATDPDREGEAIAWHVVEMLREKGVLKDKPSRRVIFHEITKKAIKQAVDTPKTLSMPMVNAQQARRALDFLVGFNLSPLLWRKIKTGLSAGRVQSPALRMIVERELEIEAFISREYWTVEADLSKEEKSFPGRLSMFAGEKIEQFSITDEKRAEEVKATLLKAASGKLLIELVQKKQRKRNPSPPFTTSTLQQEASRKLGFTTRRTMQVAQGLYEGVDVGEGTVGLITYMRTDSVTLSNDALTEIRSAIESRYGVECLPDKPRFYKTKAKNAQEAHEAVRPTSAALHPDDIKDKLTTDQFKLYDLIWKRAVACQMEHALFNTMSVDLAPEDRESGHHKFRATGSVLVKPGFLRAYSESVDDEPADDNDRVLPNLEEGDFVDLKEVIPSQHFTEPPPRYTEASLVKTLEEYGIGRPSTYASIISTLQSREYVELEKKRFTPTDIGRIVNGFLTEHFTRYVDYEFTAKLEDELDAISRGEKEWVPVLEKFWVGFEKQVADKMESVSRADVMKERQLGIEPKSGKPMSARMGRYGPFVQLGTRDDEEKPKFASLKKGQKLNEITLEDAIALLEGQEKKLGKDPETGKPITARIGRYGPFVQLGDRDDEEKPKYASLGPVLTMETVTLEDALKLLAMPRALGKTEDDKNVVAGIGRYGPYIRYGSQYVSLTEHDPLNVTLEEALVVIKEKGGKGMKRAIQDFADEGIQVLKGRYGPYVTDGEKNGKIPDDIDPAEITLAECQEILANVQTRKKKKKKKKVAKKKTTKKKTKKKKVTKKKASKKKKKVAKKKA